MEQQQESQLIALDGKRAVTFRDKGQPFTYHFGRITDADYRNLYFPGLSVSSENANGVMLNKIDVWTPALALLDAKLERVEGYIMREGDLMQLPNWKQKLPHGHREKAMDLLLDVTPSAQAPASDYFDPDCTEVWLDAIWGLNQAEDGPANRKFLGLVHRFTPPSAAQSQKWNRAAGESRVVGGSRRMQTVRAGKHGLMADLYDELIISVDGYSVGGTALADAAAVKREMDTFHKVAAIRLLFAAPDDEAAAQEAA